MRIGVFDSGIGGLTVLQALRARLPEADFVYLADTIYAPYGPKEPSLILARSKQIVRYFIENYSIDAIVIACNSATTVAVEALRERFDNLIIVGTEPGVKPAIAKSKSKTIAIMATEATLNSSKFGMLLQSLQRENSVTFLKQPCPCLATLIEQGDLLATKALMAPWIERFRKNNADTVVLGCTHYPLISTLIEQMMDCEGCTLETSKAIANHLASLLEGRAKGTGDLKLLATERVNEVFVERHFDFGVGFKTVLVK